MTSQGYSDGVRCRFCGAVPAVMTTVREHHGMLILMQNLSLKGPFCRVHGMEAVTRMTTKSLLLGWWGLISLFVANPLTLLSNLVAWTKIRGLAPPQQTPQGYGQQQPAYQQPYGQQQAYAPPQQAYPPQQQQPYAPQQQQYGGQPGYAPSEPQPGQQPPYQPPG